ncbi:hypothetical protein LEP1GSC115_3977 [Leptospira interrogans serovar Australis str. 200703203]|uniref:Uncharacterized protein n=1 Tax=Leptospira interrogans serovar Australis str. 200703203 TaxID=1085541 RepID=N1UJ30_LEPIR|nr:hypothetical protein LEP1GSC115_3977 [Leptospira interrogans serovar Australis str. 200703203]
MEEGNADLRKVYEEIIKFGVILDDLSLLKVTYNPEDSKTKE